MPIYIDESGSLPAGAMIMAGVEIDAEAADALLARFRAVTGLHGELKGSRIEIIERAFFFELLHRFGGRAEVSLLHNQRGPEGRPEDFDVYVALLDQLVRDWLPKTDDCTKFIVDAGRYDAMVLEGVRKDILRLLPNCGSASLVDSRRSAGVQIADVVANSFYNIAVNSGRAGRIGTIIEPFLQSGMLRRSLLRDVPAPKQKHPALRGNAGRPVQTRTGRNQPS